MKQITIVHQNNALHVAGVKDNGEIIEPELTESLQTLILQLIEALDEIKTPEEELQEQIKDYLKDNAPDEVLLNFKVLFDPWQIGKDYTDELFIYEGDLYRVIQPITAMSHYPPNIVPAHYTKITLPGEHPEWIPGSWDLGAIVTHKGSTWESMVPDNTWEPGAPGVYDNVWRKIES